MPKGRISSGSVGSSFALSGELLNWHVAHVRQEELEQFRLDDQEAVVLQMRRWGDSAKDTAGRIGVSEVVAYKIFQRINEKMGASVSPTLSRKPQQAA